MNEHEWVKAAMKALLVDVPVLAWRVVGNRVELYLYGGRVVVWNIPGSAEEGGNQEKTETQPQFMVDAPTLAGGGKRGAGKRVGRPATKVRRTNGKSDTVG